jgi:hypothetical protein
MVDNRGNFFIYLLTLLFSSPTPNYRLERNNEFTIPTAAASFSDKKYTGS